MKKKRTIKQKNTAMKEAKILHLLLIDKKYHCLVMDDESYFKYDFSTITRPQYFNAENNKNGFPDQVKSISIKKDECKVLVWQAICRCGNRISPFFHEDTINCSVYVSDCLQKHLFPFLKRHNGSVLFCPELATPHYSKLARDCLSTNEVKLLGKKFNPPNTPDLRPAERKWAFVNKACVKIRNVLNISTRNYSCNRAKILEN